MFVWESADFVHWSSPWAVTLGVPSAGCVWAPEAIYDEDADDFLVFWVSATQEPNEIFFENISHRADGGLYAELV